MARVSKETLLSLYNFKIERSARCHLTSEIDETMNFVLFARFAKTLWIVYNPNV